MRCGSGWDDRYEVSWAEVLSAALAGMQITDATAPQPRAHDTDGGDRWECSFFVSLDVVAVDATGRLGIDWHLAVVSTPVVADPAQADVVDATFAGLRGRTPARPADAT